MCLFFFFIDGLGVVICRKYFYLKILLFCENFLFDIIVREIVRGVLLNV